MKPLKEISKKNAFTRMALLCARKEMCVSDISKKLSDYALSDVDKIAVIQQLKSEKYIDEYRYARSFIHDKSRFNKWGKVKIRYALLQKSISPEIIDNAFSEFSDESLSEPLTQLLRTKSKSIKYENTFDKRNKLIRFALGRGFEMQDILCCLDKLET